MIIATLLSQCEHPRGRSPSGTEQMLLTGRLRRDSACIVSEAMTCTIHECGLIPCLSPYQDNITMFLSRARSQAFTRNARCFPKECRCLETLENVIILENVILVQKLRLEKNSLCSQDSSEFCSDDIRSCQYNPQRYVQQQMFSASLSDNLKLTHMSRYTPRAKTSGLSWGYWTPRQWEVRRSSREGF
jgi:hypothetical protein